MPVRSAFEKSLQRIGHELQPCIKRGHPRRPLLVHLAAPLALAAVLFNAKLNRPLQAVFGLELHGGQQFHRLGQGVMPGRDLVHSFV